MKQRNPNIKIIGEYVNAHTHIRCECVICGNHWSTTPANLISGCGCPACGYKKNKQKQRKAHQDFIHSLSEINSDIVIIGEYSNNKTPIKCRCKRCQHVWYAAPFNLLKGTGCPLHNSSHGEMTISNWLSANGIGYVTQKRFDDLVGIGGRKLPYDFYIPTRNILIEYQGNFHDKTDRIQSDSDYHIRVKHDGIKRAYAESNHIGLFEIWYYDNITEKLQEIFGITDPVTTTAS